MKKATKLDALEHLKKISQIVETGDFIEVTISTEKPYSWSPAIKGRNYLRLTIDLITKEVTGQ